VNFLTENKISKVSFSKYGSFYQKSIRAEGKRIYGGLLYA